MNSISIHALREEGDAVSGWATRLLLNFYPRPPRGGRLLEFGQILRCFGISIHALREEGDDTPSKIFSFLFSFLSTPSARRATLNCPALWSI